MQPNRIFVDKKKDEKIEHNITDIKKSVFVGQCEGSQLDFTGKFNSLSADKCENVKITVESLISSLELMNSKNVKVGVTDSVKHFQVDKCSDVTLNVKNHEGVMITHTGCKNFNLEMNGKSLKLPSSFVSTFSKGKFDHVIATNDKCCA